MNAINPGQLSQPQPSQPQPSQPQPSSQQNIEAPHSGYHWRTHSVCSPARFFEGWYFRLTLPEPAQTFAFMYSIDDPNGGTAQSGGAAQILGPHETYYCRTFPDVTQFWAWLPRLGVGHWRTSTRKEQTTRKARYLSPQSFETEVREGYQATTHLHQGKLLSPSGKIQARWHYETEIIATWGEPKPRATAGWLSFLPIFEPGWQVLIAHGMATGWIEWRGFDEKAARADTGLTRYTFEQAPAYAEKNWGGAFPAKWFWMQCNAFAEEPSLSVTAAGGIREVLVLKEDVGLIGIHYKGKFYEFFSTKTRFSWIVAPWGHWQVTAESFSHRVVLTGRATDEGAWVRVPTREGMQFLCRDTTHGELTLQLWAHGDQSTLIVEAHSQLAGLEVGGGPWAETWIVSS